MNRDFDTKLIEYCQFVLKFNKDESKVIISNINSLDKKLRLHQLFVNKQMVTNRVDETAFGILWIFDFIALESLTYFDKGNKSIKLKRLFNLYLDETEKLNLLTNFIFSDKYSLGEKNRPNLFHVMRTDLIRDIDWLRENNYYHDIPNLCGVNNRCLCISWLKSNLKNINKYLEILVDNFFEMRNAIVHESWLLAMFPNSLTIGPNTLNSGSVHDVYPSKTKDKNNCLYISYESHINPIDYFQITTNCVKKYLTTNYLTKR